MKQKSIVYLGIGFSMNSHPYSSKLQGLIEKRNIKCEYWCWERRVSDHVKRVKDDYALKKVLWSYGKEGSRWTKYLYPLWMLMVFFKVLFYKKKHSTFFFCSRLDTALPLYLINLFFKLDYIYLDRDNLHQSHNWSLASFKFLQFLETKVAKASRLHVIPGDSRNYTHSNNVFSVFNTPDLETAQKAKKLKRNKKDTRFTIYINGWLKGTRGLRMISNALKELDQNKFNVIVAAPNVSGELENILTLPFVNYIGQVTNEEALSLYYESDLVLAFYDPAIIINTLAEPNKWFDCVETNTPFITNYGIKTAEKFLQEEACFLVEYDNSEELLDLLVNLEQDMGLLATVKDKLGNIHYPYWDERFNKLFDILFQS